MPLSDDASRPRCSDRRVGRAALTSLQPSRSDFDRHPSELSTIHSFVASSAYSPSTALLVQRSTSYYDDSPSSYRRHRTRARSYTHCRREHFAPWANEDMDWTTQETRVPGSRYQISAEPFVWVYVAVYLPWRIQTTDYGTGDRRSSVARSERFQEQPLRGTKDRRYIKILRRA